jgi:hypothetical protein
MAEIISNTQNLSTDSLSTQKHIVGNFLRNEVESKKEKIEAFSMNPFTSQMVKFTHASEEFNSVSNHFVQTALSCFKAHFNLALYPDQLMLVLFQGVSNHFKTNIDKYGPLFLNKNVIDSQKKGEKSKIVVIDDTLIRGSADNNWEKNFPKFQQQIEEHMTGLSGQRNFHLNFSTSNETTKISAVICLMDTFQEFFDYEVQTLCGIPKVTLLGTLQDWENIKFKVNELAKGLELDWWLNKLNPILDSIVKSFKNPKSKESTKFWDSFFKYESGSGGSHIDGWINSLFPYIQYKGEMKQSQFNARPLSISNYPDGTSIAPFLWKYLSQEFKMKFRGGFLGISKIDDYTISPAISWYIAYE